MMTLLTAPLASSATRSASAPALISPFAGEAQEPGRVAGEGRQRLLERHAAQQQLAQRSHQRTGGAYIKFTHAALAVEAGEAPSGIGTHRDALTSARHWPRSA